MNIGGNLASICTLDYGRMRSHIHKKDGIFLQLGLLFGEFLGDVEGAKYSKAWTCCSRGYNCGCLKCIEKKTFFMHDYIALEM
jgi:hypothetical protein